MQLQAKVISFNCSCKSQLGVVKPYPCDVASCDGFLHECQDTACSPPAALPVEMRQTQPAGTKLSDKFTGTVCEVVSGDCLVVRDAANGQERRVNLSSIRAPRLGRKGEKPEDWATEAKEFLRQRLIGQSQPFWSSLL